MCSLGCAFDLQEDLLLFGALPSPHWGNPVPQGPGLPLPGSPPHCCCSGPSDISITCLQVTVLPQLVTDTSNRRVSIRVHGLPLALPSLLLGHSSSRNPRHPCNQVLQSDHLGNKKPQSSLLSTAAFLKPMTSCSGGEQ